MPFRENPFQMLANTVGSDWLSGSPDRRVDAVLQVNGVEIVGDDRRAMALNGFKRYYGT
jgi:hypothetical protein